MCFSATGSFIAAAINAAAGIAALRKTAGTTEAVLAFCPVTFAVQQGLEGTLWLALPVHASPVATFQIANGFVFLALCFWPIFVPLATLMLERSGRRRGAMLGLLILGTAFATYALMNLMEHPYSAQILGHSVSYSNGRAFPFVASLLYVVCTCLPLLLSTQRSLRLLGACVLAGLIVSYVLFFYAFLSVWCFFAALASGLVFFRAYSETVVAAPRLT